MYGWEEAHLARHLDLRLDLARDLGREIARQVASEGLHHAAESRLDPNTHLNPALTLPPTPTLTLAHTLEP